MKYNAYLYSINDNKLTIMNTTTEQNTSTQMCTIANVKKMALEHMNKTFTYRGRTFNLNNLGWSFKMNTNKSRFGVCKAIGGGRLFAPTSKRIELSSWLVTNADKTFDEWVNTMLHEIAHAIDIEVRGTSSHDNRWRNIALAIGCDGEVYGNFEVDTKNSKYTIKCTNCGHERAGHKYSKRVAEGHASCGKCGNGYFDKSKLLEQIKNY